MTENSKGDEEKSGILSLKSSTLLRLRLTRSAMDASHYFTLLARRSPRSIAAVFPSEELKITGISWLHSLLLLAPARRNNRLRDSGREDEKEEKVKERRLETRQEQSWVTVDGSRRRGCCT